MMTLLVTVGEEARWLGDGSGFMSCDVHNPYLAHFTFVMRGIELIAQNYPGNVAFRRQDYLATKKDPLNGNRATTA
jgi:hypothetical protein